MIRHFDEELQRLQDRMLRMAGIVENMIGICGRALQTGSEEGLAGCFALEQEVNRLHRELWESVVLLIARHQPVANDLRLLVAALNIITNLERMGDLAVNLSRKTQDLTRRGTTPLLERLVEMLEMVRGMVARGVQAFVTRDSATAEDILRQDDVVDEARDQITRQVLDSIPGDRDTACQLIETLLACRNLERIADSTTNMAEDVIYLAEGRDVRHKIGESHERPGSWEEIRHIGNRPVAES